MKHQPSPPPPAPAPDSWEWHWPSPATAPEQVRNRDTPPGTVSTVMVPDRPPGQAVSSCAAADSRKAFILPRKMKSGKSGKAIATARRRHARAFGFDQCYPVPSSTKNCQN